MLVRVEMADEMTECEGEIDENGRVSLPEANALKKRGGLETRSGSGRWETAAGTWDRARNREESLGADGVKRLTSTR